VAIKRKTITHSSVRKSEISRATFWGRFHRPISGDVKSLSGSSKKVRPRHCYLPPSTV